MRQTYIFFLLLLVIGTGLALIGVGPLSSGDSGHREGSAHMDGGSIRVVSQEEAQVLGRSPSRNRIEERAGQTEDEDAPIDSPSWFEDTEERAAFQQAYSEGLESIQALLAQDREDDPTGRNEQLRELIQADELRLGIVGSIPWGEVSNLKFDQAEAVINVFMEIDANSKSFESIEASDARFPWDQLKWQPLSYPPEMLIDALTHNSDEFGTYRDALSDGEFLLELADLRNEILLDYSNWFGERSAHLRARSHAEKVTGHVAHPESWEDVIPEFHQSDIDREELKSRYWRELRELLKKRVAAGS